MPNNTTYDKSNIQSIGEADPAFEQLKETGTEISPVAEGWINYVGTTDATFTPTPLGMAFLAIVAIMYAAIIWYPKQK